MRTPLLPLLGLVTVVAVSAAEMAPHQPVSSRRQALREHFVYTAVPRPAAETEDQAVLMDPFVVEELQPRVVRALEDYWAQIERLRPRAALLRQVGGREVRLVERPRIDTARLGEVFSVPVVSINW